MKRLSHARVASIRADASDLATSLGYIGVGGSELVSGAGGNDDGSSSASASASDAAAAGAALRKRSGAIGSGATMIASDFVIVTVALEHEAATKKFKVRGDESIGALLAKAMRKFDLAPADDASAVRHELWLERPGAGDDVRLDAARSVASCALTAESRVVLRVYRAGDDNRADECVDALRSLIERHGVPTAAPHDELVAALRELRARAGGEDDRRWRSLLVNHTRVCRLLLDVFEQRYPRDRADDEGVLALDASRRARDAPPLAAAPVAAPLHTPADDEALCEQVLVTYRALLGASGESRVRSAWHDHTFSVSQRRHEQHVC